MSFHARLLTETAAARAELLATPIIQGALAGRVSRPSYIAFLREAYHHVRHTVPLLQAMKAALPPQHAWLAPALDEYIEEEAGHDEWILDDIRACGGDAEAVRHGRAGHATEVMVAYAYDTIARVHPAAFFGMVLALEGTSTALALNAAAALKQHLGLDARSLRYLTSHGQLDQQHIGFYEGLMDRIEDPGDRAAVIHAARMFYGLYGQVFESIRAPATKLAEAA